MHSLVDPAQVVGDSGVDPICPLMTATNPPADDPGSPEAVVFAYGEGTSTVPLAGVHPSLWESGTKHVICQPGYLCLFSFLRSDWISAYLLVHHSKVYILQPVCQNQSLFLIGQSKARHYSANQEETFQKMHLNFLEYGSRNCRYFVKDSPQFPYPTWPVFSAESSSGRHIGITDRLNVIGCCSFNKAISLL